MSLVLDTGPLLALLDRDDPDHSRCVDLVAETSEALVVPAPVLVEVDYWCRKLLGLRAWTMFVEDLSAGAYRLFNLDADAVALAAQIEAQYADLRLGFVDAAVVATCEVLGETKVVTLDRRHFSVVRGTQGSALRLLPD